MSGSIGYYVHHHGSGHLARALAIVGQTSDHFTVLGTGLAGRTGGVPFIDLEDDRALDDASFRGNDGVKHRPEALHYAPLGHPGVRRRVSVVAGWIETCAPSLMVIDVSVELAMLSRLAATPTVYVRLSGDRTDPAHLEAFRGAAAILAPFHPDLDDPLTPSWVRAKTKYFPAMGPQTVSVAVDPAKVVVVFGSGGGEANGAVLAGAARRTPERMWHVLGPATTISDPPPNLAFRGWVDDAEAEIASAGVVVGSAGDGVVGAVMAADRPFLCLPQARPYAEQTSKAHALGALGAAVILDSWPQDHAWPELLLRAQAPAGDARTRLSRGGGAAEARAWIQSLAAACQTSTGANQ